MGSARVQGILCWWCDISNEAWISCDGGVKGFWWVVCCYLRGRGFGPFVSSFSSTSCLSLINIPTLCLLLVDLGPRPLPRLE